MSVKKPRLALCLALAGAMAVPGVFAFDNSPYGNQQITNYLYCNATHFISGFDRNEIQDVSVGVYFGTEIPDGERNESVKAVETTRDRYLQEFGINLVPYYRGNVEIPALTSSDELADMVSDEDDFELVFTHKASRGERIIDADSNLVAMVVRVSPAYAECMPYLLMHEIAHMFYAEHSEKPSSIMFSEVFCSDFQKFDNEARRTIEIHKKRIW
ncbi:MAG: hypothetical protein KJ955_03365 [Nanoarchaeota archaeon]|nr:hypothetical protein [Nanoarchaeota archaeon]